MRKNSASELATLSRRKMQVLRYVNVDLGQEDRGYVVLQESPRNKERRDGASGEQWLWRD